MRWVIFLSVFSALYGGLHVYAIWRAAQAGFHGIPFYAAVIAFSLLMIATPILVRLVEGQGHHELARFMALVGFTWMGFVFLFFCTGIVEDGLRLLALGVGKLTGGQGPWTLPRPKAFLLVFLLSAVFVAWGALDAWRIRTDHVLIHTSKIPAGMERFRIVQLSDVHLGLIVAEGRLERILDAVRAADPDLLVCTGDLVDGLMDNHEELAAMLRGVPARHGKVAVIGNHEYYAGIRRAMEFTERAGFTILRGEAAPFLPWLSIAGMDDPAGRGAAGWVGAPEKEILSTIPKDRFALLLKHRPYLEESSLGLFDLQLSGHTHQGQIFPFTLIIRLIYPTAGGRLDLADGSTLYVNRGSGTWGPPIRFLAPPEVTVIDLVPVRQQANP